MFNDPNLLGKIAGNPTTKHLLADPTFMSKLRQVQQNPQMLQQEIMQDQRLMQVMAMLLGINMSMPGEAGETGEPMQTDEPVIINASFANVDSRSISPTITAESDTEGTGEERRT